VKQLADGDGECALLPEWRGTCGRVDQVVIGDNEMVVFGECAAENTASIVLRGPNTDAQNEVNGAPRDALNAVKRVTESHHVVAGADASRRVSRCISIGRDGSQGPRNRSRY
jgi:chaperonin GroEL (HSP60 family)